MTTPDPQPELVRLANRYCDVALESGELAQLQALLQQDPQARKVFCQVVGLHADLVWQRGPERPLSPVSKGQTGDGTTQRVPSVPVDLALPLRTPVLGFLGRTTAALNRPVFWSVLAAGVLFAGYFVVISWNMLGKKLPSGTDGNEITVALISDTQDAQWSPKSKPSLALDKGSEAGGEGAVIKQGEPLQITSGLVELQLKQGTTLLVEGPAEWTIEGKNNATLKHGKLVAKVPQQAIGFTLNTPTAKIVDLGTEFGVEATERGSTEVQVLRGSVVLQAKTPPGQSPIPAITLPAGSARRVELSTDGVATIRDISHDPGRVVATVREPPSRSIRVAGVLVSSQRLPERDAYDLVNGSGLVGDTHSNDPNAMWISELHKVKGEYVLFDLGKPYRLESMKVWNYNENTVEPFYKMCGVKQASIYASLSGRFNATAPPNTWEAKLPEAWHVVTARRPFAMADGTSAYKPIVIPLEGIAARFVAIVIDDHFGEVPGLSLTHQKCVGLSEVQFFGKPVSSLKSVVQSNDPASTTTVDLADIIAGGDGRQHRRNLGIDPTNGQVVEMSRNDYSHFDYLSGDGLYHRTPDHPFVDGVAVVDATSGPVQLDSAGHVFGQFGTKDGRAYGPVWPGGALPDPPGSGAIASTFDGKVDFADAPHGFIALVPNKLITFDLDAIRRAYPGCSLTAFRSVAGNTKAGWSRTDIWVFVDGTLCFDRRGIKGNEGPQTIDVAIGPAARFLTLVATDGGDTPHFDHVIFGDPRIELTKNP